MDPHPGTAHPLLLLAVVVTLGYATACWMFPFRNCPLCHGTGKRRSSSGSTFRYCRWCRGTGGRLRIGRRLWNAAARLHRGGTR